MRCPGLVICDKSMRLGTFFEGRRLYLLDSSVGILPEITSVGSSVDTGSAFYRRGRYIGAKGSCAVDDYIAFLGHVMLEQSAKQHDAEDYGNNLAEY